MPKDYKDALKILFNEIKLMNWIIKKKKNLILWEDTNLKKYPKMKKNVSLFMLFIFVFLTSCEFQQSELNLSAIKGRATVKGRIMYKAGEVVVGSYVNEIWKPATGNTVYAYIDNASLSGNSQAVGETAFAAVIDSIGNYEFSIPATISGVSVRLVYPTIQDTYKTYLGLNPSNSVATYQTSEGYYSASPSTLTIHDGQLYLKDYNSFSFTARTVISDVQSPLFVKISGSVVYPYNKVSTDQLSVSTFNAAAIGKVVNITKDGNVYSAKTRKVTVNNVDFGVYDIYVPIDGISESVYLTFSAASFDSTMTKYSKDASLKYTIPSVSKGRYSASSTNLSTLLKSNVPVFVNSPISYSFTEFPDFAQ